MDHTRDNPLKRFKAFWIALLLVFSFGVALILLRPLTHMDGESPMDAAGKQRLEVKREVDRAQDDALNEEGLEKAFASQLKTFSENTIGKGAMPVPGAAPAESGEDATEDPEEPSEETE